MEDLFFAIESSYNGSMLHPNNELNDAIFTYRDFLLTNHYVTEAVREGFWVKVKKFFTKIILAIKDFNADLKLKIEYTIRQKEINKKLKAMRDELVEKELLGKTTTEVLDVWNYKQLYLELNKKLSRYGKKFAKVKYTKVYQIDDDIDKFNAIVREYSDKMEEASTKKITIPVKKALDFVESELKGQSDVLKTLNNAMLEFQELQHDAENMQTKIELLGDDVVPKHVGFIQHIVNVISLFIRKWTTKFIMSVVFIFA